MLKLIFQFGHLFDKGFAFSNNLWVGCISCCAEYIINALVLVLLAGLIYLVF